MNETQDQNLPPLRPEAYVVRGDRSLAAMVLLICTLGGVGIGFGSALYMLRVSSFRDGGRPHKLASMTWLGASLDNRDPVKGARVMQVYDSSPASRAGLQIGDVILRVDESWVTNPNDLVREVRDRDPGDRAVIVVNRNGCQRKLNTILTAY